MTRHVFTLLALAIIAIAGWAYSVSYNTLDTLERIEDLRGDIAREREAIQVLRIEWAYLNNPERLARLARRYADQLRLEPLTPEALQRAAVVPFLPTAPPVGNGRGKGGFPVPRPRPVAWRPE